MTIEIVSVHVPKTAGTSFCRVLKQVYGEEAVFLDNGEYPYGDLAAIPLEPHHRAIHGHVWAGKYKRLLPKSRHVAWLRHPVDWLISLYRFLDTLGPNENPAWKYLKSERPSLLDFAASEGVHTQTQSRFLQHLTVDDFFFVGLQECFAEDLVDLGALMGWPPVAPPEENRNTTPEHRKLRADVWSDQALVDGLCERLRDDMELYEAARLRRARRRELALAG